MRTSFALLTLVARAQSLDFYVSPAGSDANSGSSSSPFATPARAVAAIASAKAANGGQLPSSATVNLGSGVYFLQTPLAVSSASGGDGTHTVTFSGPADPSAPPAVISAGAPIAGPWTPVSSGVYSAPFPAAAGDMIRQMWDASTGVRMLLSRSDVGFARAAGDWGVAYPRGMLTPADVGTLEGGGELVLWHNWVNSQNKIANVNIDNSSISVVGEAGDPFFGPGGTLRFALQNVANPATLAPGSFYVRNRVIFFKPASGLAPAAGALIVEALREAVVLSGAVGAPIEGVSFANLTIAHAAADLEASCGSAGCGGQSCSESTNAAVHVSNAFDCHMTGVEVVGSGSYGVWFDSGCASCSITNSWLHDLGMGGVRVGSTANTGSTATEPTRNVTVSDNTIEDGGHVVPAGTGVLAQESYATHIVHNHVHHLYYTGVSTGWTWGYAADSDSAHEVGFNHIHHIFQKELSDGGCIYNLGRSPGTLIINNLCHDVDSYGYGGWGLYTDEGSSNVTLRDNIVFATKDAGFHQHYGTDNVITNNIFAFPSTLPCNASAANGQCDEAALRSSQHMDCWNPGKPVKDYGCNSSFAFTGNIIYLGKEQVAEGVVNATTTVFKTFTAYNQPKVNGLSNMTWGSNVYWSNALANPATDLVFGTEYERLPFPAWQTLYHDVDSVVADPLFADAASRNFTLLPGSPALALGFKQIDMSTVGPRAPFRRA